MSALEQAQATIAELQRQLALKDSQIDELTTALSVAKSCVERLEHEVKRLLRRLYGPKSEAFRHDPRQGLFDNILAEALEQARNAGEAEVFIPPEEPPAGPPRQQGRRHKHGRPDLELLENVLECEDVIVDVAEEEKVCPETGEPMAVMGHEVTRKLDVIPGRLVIRRYIRAKYVSPRCPEAGVVTAQLPAFPIPKGIPKSPIAGAIGYAVNQREALTRFLEDGRLRLDNNWAENHMRPMALGRGNYLFVGSERGGKAAAVIYSFTESCRLAGINPVEYFSDVLWRINSHPPNRLFELLPCNWEPGPPRTNRIVMPPMPRSGVAVARPP